MGLTKMKPIYGPVPSWRLGRSLGIDPISREENTCTFDCAYCQLGKTIHKTNKRQIFVDEEIIKKELKKVKNKAKADIITLSGTGEPTLAKNLGKIVDTIKENTNLPIAILTNSSLLYRKDVKKDLKKSDIVIAKLDAPNETLFKEINRPHKTVTFKKIINGIRSFRKQFNGKLSLQMMFTNKNRKYAPQMAKLAKELKADEVQINTPLRPCPVKPLNKKEINKIKEKFKDLNIVSVYDAKKPKVKIISMYETLIRRPKI